MAQCNYDQSEARVWLQVNVVDKLTQLEAKVDAIAQQIEALELVTYKTCTMCQGSGQVVPSYSPPNPPPTPITCPRCSGAGKIRIGESVEKD